MLRLLYLLSALLEIVLILLVILYFLITDDRAVKLAAEYGMNHSDFAYKEIEGNLFEGIKVKGLSFANKKLCKEATLYWNPLTLMYHNVTIRQLNMKGVDIENVMAVIKEFQDKSTSNSSFNVALSFALKRVHFDFKPYSFEGIHFRNIQIDADEILVQNDLSYKVKNLRLKLNSELSDLSLKGKIEENALLLDEVALKNISTVAITDLVHQLKMKYASRKSKKTQQAFVPFNNIEARHIVGTLKPVSYGVLDLEGATVHIYNASVNPYERYNYRAKRVLFLGETNFAKVALEGTIEESTIDADGMVTAKKELFERYALPLNYEGLKNLPSHLTLTHHGVWVDVEHRVPQLLSKYNQYFQMDVHHARHRISYIYGKDLIIDSELEANSTYANYMDATVKTVVNFKTKEATYTGSVQASSFKKVVPEITNYLLEGLRATFKGKNKELFVNLDSNLVEGSFRSLGYKDATLILNSKQQNIALNQIVPNIDERFQNEFFAFRSKSYLDFHSLEASHTHLEVNANLIEFQADAKLQLPFHLKAIASIPPNSMLRELNKKFNFDALNNIDIDLLIDNNLYDIKVEDRVNVMSLTLLYNSETKIVERGKLYLGSEEIDFKSQEGDRVAIETHISDIQKFLRLISPYYPLNVPNIRGAVNVTLVQENKQTHLEVNSHLLNYQLSSGAELKIFDVMLNLEKKGERSFIDLKSPNVEYVTHTTPEDKIFHINNIEAHFSVDEELNILLDSYQFKIDKNPYLYQFYATKPSSLALVNNQLLIKKLWVNDKIEVKGNYDIERLEGELKVMTKSYAYGTGDFEIVFDADLVVKLQGVLLDISGDIELLYGSINYEVETSGLVEDSDIIVIQEMKEEKESLLNNISLYLKVHNKKPLHYYGKDTKIDFLNKLTIVKSFNQKIFVTGMTTIINGYYEIEDKHFSLDESHLYFAGDVKKPLLDIKANYLKDQYNIHIFISGTTDEPIINFNSEPYLKQQEILSLILFDGTGSSDGMGAEAYTILGGTFAKGLMKSIGINVDHFLLGTDEENQLSLEVGGRITNNISLLYLNKNGLNGAKVRIEHSNNFETDIIVMPPNTSSIEFLYKDDY